MSMLSNSFAWPPRRLICLACVPAFTNRAHLTKVFRGSSFAAALTRATGLIAHRISSDADPSGERFLWYDCSNR